MRIVAVRSIDEFDLPHRILDAAELRVRYPQFHVEDDDIGVLDEPGGAMRSELAVAAATDQALARGAAIHYDTTVLALEPGNEVHPTPHRDVHPGSVPWLHARIRRRTRLRHPDPGWLQRQGDPQHGVPTGRRLG
jgi:hypothetical protein